MSTEGEIVADNHLIDALVTLRAQQLLQQLNAANPTITPPVALAAPPPKPSIFAKKDANPPAVPAATPAAPPAAKPSIFAKKDANPPAVPAATPAAPPAAPPAAKPSIFVKKDANPPPTPPAAPNVASQASAPTTASQPSAPTATTSPPSPPTAPTATGSPTDRTASPASESAFAPAPETLDIAVHEVVADMGDTAALAGELGLDENELKEILADLPADFEARVAAEAARLAGEG